MISVRFCVISDTHNKFSTSELPEMDVLLHCGDLTQIGGLLNYRKALQSMDAVPAELKLVIAGNHNVTLDKEWWSDNLVEGEDDLSEPELALKFFENAKARGIHYLEEGTDTFTLKSGAHFTVYASPYTPEFNGYAFAYA